MVRTNMATPTMGRGMGEQGTLGGKRTWRRWGETATRHPYRAASLLFALLLLIYIPTLRVPHTYGLLVGSDGIGYFANLRSLVFDHDLQLSDEYARLTGTALSGSGTAKFPVGVAVLWLPFFLVMHLVVLALHAAGQPVVADGYSWFYQFGACFGTMVYGYLGLLLMIRLCREFFDTATTLLATFLLFCGWNIIYYFLFENSMSHMVSLFVVGALLARWRFGPRDKPLRYWGGIGLCVGVAAMVRPQDAAFVVVPGIDLATRVFEAARARRWAGAARLAGGALSLGIGSLIGYSPQIVASQATYGHPFASGYFVKGETFSWTTPHIFQILFSRWHGLVTWHPLILLTLIGLYVLGRTQPAYAARLAVAVAIQIYVVASWHAWWQGDAFGSRMLINCAPAFALGLAALITWVRARVDVRVVLAVAALALLWNGLFIAQYRLGLISKAEPITWQQLTVGKLTMLPHLTQTLRHFVVQHQQYHLR